jgi:tetratricopeptide (TPR) repeat protein
MERIEINLISLDIRRWDLENERLNIKIVYVIEDQENINYFDLSLIPVHDMVEEFINKLRKEGEQKIASLQPEQQEISLEIINEGFLRQKLHNFFKRIMSELNNPKRKKGSSRMIYSTHMDVYNENQDLSFLSPAMQFFVVLNWARRYYEKEDYQRAVDPLRKLVKLKPDYAIAYKWLARSLKKVRKYDEAMRYYEQYARVDNSLDSKLDLAKSYRKGKLFDQSEEIYKEILQNYPGELEARIGLAQIQYARNETDYLPVLEELYAHDQEWLKKWILEEFNFRIYSSPKTPLTPIQVSQYLGFGKVAELTQMAFRNEIPSHFNPTKARMSFYKEEIDRWAGVINRFQLFSKEIKLYPENLKSVEIQPMEVDEEKEEPADVSEVSQTERVMEPISTRVEQIIKQIREARAKRNSQFSRPAKSAEAKNEIKKVKRGRKSKKDTEEAKPAEDQPPAEDQNQDQSAPAAEKDDNTPKDKNKSKKKKSTENGPAGIDLPTEEEFLFENNN